MKKKIVEEDKKKDKKRRKMSTKSLYAFEICEKVCKLSMQLTDWMNRMNEVVIVYWLIAFLWILKMSCVSITV